jgi:1-acyl-sn-glycerol-3-phosphate acyltransferase
VKVRFFPPAEGPRQAGPAAPDLAAGPGAEIPGEAPIAHAGRRPKPIPPMPEERGGAPGEPAPERERV